MAEIRFLDRTTPPHLVTLVALAGLSAMAMNLFLASLPNMALHFSVDYTTMQLSVTAYLAVNAVLQLIVGPLSDRYGRRRVILGGVLIFVLATVGTLLATTAETFLLFRMMQAGVVTGMALGRAVVRDIVDETQAASMIGYISMFMAVVPMIGPAIGGLVEEAVGYRGSFAIMLVAGVLVLALAWADLGETNTRRSSGFVAQLRDYPELFRSQRFWGYVLTNSFTSGLFFTYLAGAPFVADDHYQLPPSVTGFFFGTSAVGYILGNYLTGRFTQRVGMNRMILFGALVMAGGLGVLAAAMLLVEVSPFFFFAMFSFIGLGNGLVIPNATAGTLSVRPHLAGTASGLGGAFQIGGGAALATLAGVVLVPGSGPWPLLMIMLASNACAIVTALWVIRRARIVGA